MAWTRRVDIGGPIYDSGDGKATIRVAGEQFMLRCQTRPQGQRVDCFEELADAQEAYDTGDWSKGQRAQAQAANS